MSEYIVDTTPVPAPCVECIAKVTHRDARLEMEHRMTEIGEHSESIIVEVKCLNGTWVWTTLWELTDGPTWTTELPAIVAFRWVGHLLVLMQGGFTIEQLRDQYRWCLACAVDGRRECYSCSYCDEHGCDGNCEEGRYAHECDRADDYRGYSDEVR